MPNSTSIEDAQSIFETNFVGPEQVSKLFGSISPTSDGVPFSAEELKQACTAGEFLIYRSSSAGDGSPITLLKLIELYPEAFDSKFLEGSGYQLKSEWGIKIEPLAATDTCDNGWALCRKELLDGTRNRSYFDQEKALVEYGSNRSSAPRRRNAIEMVYDTIVFEKIRKEQLLSKIWDWSSTVTIDGGNLNVGGAGESGLQILSFSTAIKHGGLGICPTFQAKG